MSLKGEVTVSEVLEEELCRKRRSSDGRRRKKERGVQKGEEAEKSKV